MLIKGLYFLGCLQNLTLHREFCVCNSQHVCLHVTLLSYSCSTCVLTFMHARCMCLYWTVTYHNIIYATTNANKCNTKKSSINANIQQQMHMIFFFCENQISFSQNKILCISCYIKLHIYHILTVLHILHLCLHFPAFTLYDSTYADIFVFITHVNTCHSNGSHMPQQMKTNATTNATYAISNAKKNCHKECHIE